MCTKITARYGNDTLEVRRLMDAELSLVYKHDTDVTA